ncbi:hypothetical protein [Patulibacter sp.]|uniref:DUF6946 family protein n=1 Tax=Patulibacter sp. TaxID=1912859 RepID=UPI0027203651|nr:hypothetical protein [Patulibacter sp.]MDO9410085.1 hypothetical protein [Patulibacter sp.]
MPVPICSKTTPAETISSLEDWQRLASTPGKWAAGYSAMELARLWLTDAGPATTAEALRGAFDGLTIECGQAEAQVSFDRHPGGVRNHDVLAHGRTADGAVVVGIEGKVNETLDETVDEKYAKAKATRDAGKNTNLDTRVDELLAGIFGRGIAEDPTLGALRYQLLSAVAGTVAAADDNTIGAAVVVHLISTPQAKPEKFADTRAAVDAFAAALGCPQEGPLVGPFVVDTTVLKGPANLPCWLTVAETAPV